MRGAACLQVQEPPGLLIGEEDPDEVEHHQVPGGDQLRPVDHDPGVRTEGADTDIQQDGCRGDGGGQGERPPPPSSSPASPSGGRGVST